VAGEAKAGIGHPVASTMVAEFSQSLAEGGKTVLLIALQAVASVGFVVAGTNQTTASRVIVADKTGNATGTIAGAMEDANAVTGASDGVHTAVSIRDASIGRGAGGIADGARSRGRGAGGGEWGRRRGGEWGCRLGGDRSHRGSGRGGQSSLTEVYGTTITVLPMLAHRFTARFLAGMSTELFSTALVHAARFLAGMSAELFTGMSTELLATALVQAARLDGGIVGRDVGAHWRRLDSRGFSGAIVIVALLARRLVAHSR